MVEPEIVCGASLGALGALQHSGGDRGNCGAFAAWWRADSPVGLLKVAWVKGLALAHGWDDRMTPGTLANQVPRLAQWMGGGIASQLPPALAVVWPPFALSSPSPDQLHPPLPVRPPSELPLHFRLNLPPPSRQPQRFFFSLELNRPSAPLLVTSSQDSRSDRCQRAPLLAPCQPSARASFTSSQASHLASQTFSGQPRARSHYLPSSHPNFPVDQHQRQPPIPRQLHTPTAQWPVTLAPPPHSPL